MKEVEMVDSVDDLRSSSSTRGIQLPNFEVLDARIASALKRIIHNSHFNRKVSLEEQKAQKQDRFIRGRRIAYLIYEYFGVTGANDSVESYADLFTIGLRNDDIQEFDSKWDGICLSVTKKIPPDGILEGLYKLRRIRESEKLKTVFGIVRPGDSLEENQTRMSCERLLVCDGFRPCLSVASRCDRSKESCWPGFSTAGQCACADDFAVAVSSFRDLMTALAPAFRSFGHIAGLNLNHRTCCWVQYGSERCKSLLHRLSGNCVRVFAKCRLSDMPSTSGTTASRKNHPARSENQLFYQKLSRTTVRPQDLRGVCAKLHWFHLRS